MAFVPFGIVQSGSAGAAGACATRQRQGQMGQSKRPLQRPQVAKSQKLWAEAGSGTEAKLGTDTVKAMDAEPGLMLNEERGLRVPPVQVGTWQWGDRYWGYGGAYGEKQAQEAYDALVEKGLLWMDGAEVYGLGLNEKLIRRFDEASAASGKEKAMIATKFAPLPWRLTASSVPSALRASLKRLGREKVELYIQHWPGFFLNAFSNDMFLDGLAECYNQNMADAIGVSNFQQSRLRAAHARLKEQGVPLVSNQVHYSLAYRRCERNGVLETCRELGVQLFAYSPLAQGLLTGKYTESGAAKPGGARNLIFNKELMEQVRPTVETLKQIGEERGKTPAQVAVNWLLCQGVTPIVGVKSAKQADSLAGTLGWRLNSGEVDELDKVSRKITAMQGFPAENL